MTAKVLVAIASDNYVRNYLQTDALSSLSADYDIDIVALNSLELGEEVRKNPNFIGFFETDPVVSKRHDLLFGLLMWRNRKKSATFKYRWIRNSGWDAVTSSLGPWRKIRAFAKWLPSALANPKGLRIVFLGSSVIFPLSQYVLKKWLPINVQLERIVRSKPYQLVIFPSAAYDPVSVDLARLGKIHGLQSLCLIDNWDNLTSKTSFWARPDHLGVWGEQTKEQAERIHGFKPSQVHPIGTPRFDHYFSSRTADPPYAPESPPYLLFVGSAMPFDELGALKKIELIIHDHYASFTDLRIVYRPHPWQQKRNCPAQFDETMFSRTTLDPQIAAGYAKGFQPEKTEPAFQPELDYYPGLFRGARAVIGPLTTMLFEASLSLRPVIGLAYADGSHSNTTRRYFSHFDGVEQIPGFALCENQQDLEQLLLAAVSSPAITAQKSDSATNFFLHRTVEGYPRQLATLVAGIVGQ